MGKAMAVVLIAVGLVLVTPPDTASASTGCVTRHEYREVLNRYHHSVILQGVFRDQVRAIFGTPGQRIAFDPSGGMILGPLHGNQDPYHFGSELRAYRTCPPGGTVWITFYRIWDGGNWLSGSRFGPNGSIYSLYPAMWWFN